MNTNRNLFWGLACITLGVLFLARNWNLFPMPDWHFVRTLWPVLLILGGVALILRNTTPFMSVIATGLLAVALPFWLFSYMGRHRYDRDVSMRFNAPSPLDPPDVPNSPPMDMDTDTDDEDNNVFRSRFWFACRYVHGRYARTSTGRGAVYVGRWRG